LTAPDLRVPRAVEFAGIRLETRPGRVMTPRSTSLPLVERALAHIGDRAAVVADVGTGSGAVAIAVAVRAPNALVWGTDVSLDAVRLARTNARLAGVADRVRIVHGDLLVPVPEPIDVVLANLPYLRDDELALNPDLAREPGGAVFAGGDGRGCYRRLLHVLASRLAPGGLVVLQYRGTHLAARAGELDALGARFAERAA
jgi:release factor glutamine methyltransferase